MRLSYITSKLLTARRGRFRKVGLPRNHAQSGRRACHETMLSPEGGRAPAGLDETAGNHRLSQQGRDRAPTPGSACGSNGVRSLPKRRGQAPLPD